MLQLYLMGFIFHFFLLFFLFVCIHEQEHYYDPETNTGYLAWRLKTVQRNTFDGGHGCSRPNFMDSPTTQRESLLVSGWLFGEECREVLSVIRHSSDRAMVKEKMRTTFEYRQKLVHGPDATSSVLEVFPRFLDTPGLVSVFHDISKNSR